MRVAVVNRTAENLSGLKLRFAKNQPTWFQVKSDSNVVGAATFDLPAKTPTLLELPFQINSLGSLNEPATLELVSQGKVLGSVSVMLGLQNPLGGMSGSMKTSEGSLSEGVLSAFAKGQVMEPLFIPTDYALSQNFPNPFNPTTTIQYDLPQAGWVVLKVYDVLGRNIRTLVEGTNAVGRHIVRWDGKNDAGYEIPSGLYFCRMTAGAFVEIKKMLLLR